MSAAIQLYPNAADLNDEQQAFRAAARDFAESDGMILDEQ